MNTEINDKKPQIKSRKHTYIIVLMAICIMLLTWQLMVTRSKVDYVYIEKTEAERKNFDLQLELDSILWEYNSVKNEYDSVMYEKDSIISSNAEEIQKLIASQADYRRIRKQLDHLRRVTQSYVLQIDSLHQVNTVLKEENVRIQRNYEQETQRSTQLTQAKEELTEKVEMASLLKAYRTTAEGVRVRRGEREEVTDRARRVDQIKVCFTLSENLIVPEGSKTIYMRIAGPDNIILSESKSDAHAFLYEGELIQYSAKTQLNYRRKSENLCMSWDSADNFEPGVYNVSLFVDGYEIGQTSLELR